MRLDNRDNYLPEKCSKLNIKLFILYAKAQLNREQERLIDVHCGNCDDCRANLAYVYEIVKGNEQLSIDGQTLLLKYLHDPIYEHFIENLKDSIRQEILDEIRVLLVDRIKDGDTINVTIELNPSVGNYGTVNNNNKPNKPFNKTFNRTFNKPNKTFNKIFNKITNIKTNYSYFISVFLVVVFISLSVFTYLAINSNPNKQTNNPKNSLSSTIINTNNQVSNSLYQQLDIAIEQYLNSKNIDDLNKAQLIGKDIEQKYGDKYGVDLVAYYQTVPSTALERLSIYHKTLSEFFDQSTGDNYQKRLEDSLELEKKFLALGDLVEAYKTKALINKLYVQSNNFEQAKSINQEGLKLSLDKKYCFLQTYFLLWKAKHLCEIPDFINAEESFLEAIELGNKLNLYKPVNSAGSSLAMLYYRADDNKKAFDLSRKLLVNFPDYKNTQAISFLQIAGLASFNLGYYEIATSYLKEAINNSKGLNNSGSIIRSYAFLALILSEQKKFDEANNFYSLAQDELKNINEDSVRQEALSIVIGYKAKTKLLEQDYNQALNLYQQKLSILNTLHLNNNLEISQINEAMAIALSALGQKEKAQEHIAIAKDYKDLAEASKETNNCLLSLAPTSCLTR